VIENVDAATRLLDDGWTIKLLKPSDLYVARASRPKYDDGYRVINDVVEATGSTPGIALYNLVEKVTARRLAKKA